MSLARFESIVLAVAVAASAVYMIVYVAVSTFGLVRRTFSLFWPGAGS